MPIKKITRSQRILRELQKELSSEREEELSEELRGVLEQLELARLQVKKLEKRVSSILNEIDSNLD